MIATTGVCVFCGGHATTVDHILPRSRGGKNTWINTAAACDGCNQGTGDRTPVEAGMILRFEPATPSVGRARPALVRRGFESLFFRHVVVAQSGRASS